jgi:hypothetical protein
MAANRRKQKITGYQHLCPSYKSPMADDFVQTEDVFCRSTQIFFLTRRPALRSPYGRCPMCRPGGRTGPGASGNSERMRCPHPGANRGRPCVDAARLRLLRRVDIQSSRNQRARAPPLSARRCRIVTRHCGLKLLTRTSPVPPTAVACPGDSRHEASLREWAAARGRNPFHRHKTLVLRGRRNGPLVRFWSCKVPKPG